MFIKIPINGNESEFGGILSATSIRKTVMERRVVTQIETFSPKSNRKKILIERKQLSNKPLSDGTQNPRKATIVIRKHGRIILNT
jgi:hypothetical protein